MKKETRIQESYDESAEDYDEEWSYYIEATTRETMRRLDAADHERILDVGCGTGATLSDLLESNPRRLVGLDLSTGMLQRARENLGGFSGLIGASARRLPFRAGVFDLVLSSNAFHFFVEPRTFLEDVKRILEPGGQLVITDWCDDYWACRLCDYYLRFTDPAHTRVYGSSTVTTWLTELGFGDLTIDTYKIDWIWGLMTITARRMDTS